MPEITPELLARGLVTYVVLLFSLSVHESAHAWTALRMGDDTAQRQGRISLNPLVHIDLLGTFIIPLVQLFASAPLLGWARPTPVDPRAFKNERQGQVLVSGAGPISNLLLALGFTAVLFVAVKAGAPLSRESFLVTLLATGVQLNVLLALFNLLPLPPLDGSHVAAWGLPPALGESYRRFVEPFGPWLLLLLFVSGALGPLLGPMVRFFTRLLFDLVR